MLVHKLKFPKNKESTGFLLPRSLPVAHPEPAATADARRLAFHAPRAPLSASNPIISRHKTKTGLNYRPALVLWRGLHPPNNKNIFKSFIGENYQIPAFDLSLGLFWAVGINGEKFISGVPTGA